MRTWLKYLRNALSHSQLSDSIASGKKTPDLKTSYRFLKPYLKKHWTKAVGGIFLFFSASLLSYPQPLIQRFFIDNVLLAKNFSLLPIIIIILLAVHIFSIIARTLQGFLFTRLEQEIILEIKHDLLNRLLHFPKAFFDNKQTGYLVSRVSGDVSGLQFFFSSTLISLIDNSLRMIVGISLLLYLEWRISLLILIILPFFLVLTRFFSGKLKNLSHSNMEQSARASQYLQETLGAIPLIKSFATEKRELGKVMQAIKSSQNLSLEQNVLSSLAGLAMGSLRDLSQYLLYLCGGIAIIRGQWSLGSLLAFQSYLGYVFGPANFFAQTHFSWQNALTSVQRINSFYAVLPEEHLIDGLQVKHLKGKIEFKDVSFSYDGITPVLENISLVIEPGQKIALMGPSGVGKTTLISLILAFYRPTKGEILFDGLPLSKYNLKFLRTRIGYVGQSTRLLSGTILENLQYGREQASEAEAIVAAKVAGIHDFICQQALGYQSLLGENGVNLSEGQRQRLSIARALVKDPDILIFDEPTAHLDLASEQAMLEALFQMMKNKTLIIIAHRASTVKKADKIAMLKDKQLVGFDAVAV